MQRFPAADIEAYFVWIDMLPGDSESSAANAAATLGDPRAKHFHDNGALGRSVAAAFGYPEETAWDCYLLYAPGHEWRTSVPLPDSFAHQLDGAPAELQSSFRSGEELIRFLGAEAERLLPGRS